MEIEAALPALSERELKQLAGVKSVSADLDAKTATIEWDAPATEEGITALLAEIGYPATG